MKVGDVKEANPTRTVISEKAVNTQVGLLLQVWKSFVILYRISREQWHDTMRGHFTRSSSRSKELTGTCTVQTSSLAALQPTKSQFQGKTSHKIGAASLHLTGDTSLTREERKTSRPRKTDRKSKPRTAPSVPPKRRRFYVLEPGTYLLRFFFLHRVLYEYAMSWAPLTRGKRENIPN